MTRSGCTLALVMLWVFSSIAVYAMTFVPMSVEDLTRSSVATVVGTVERLNGSKSADGQIFTLVTVVVDRVVQGDLTAPVITLKQPGGTVGTEQEVLFGAPSFEPGEQVVLFLTVGADGSLRTNQLALGKFDIELNAEGVPQAVQRFERGTTVLVPRGASPLPSSIPLDDLLSEVEGAAPATDGAAAFQTEPPEATAASQFQEFTEPFKFLGSPPSRFFEPDAGGSINYKIDQTGDATLGLTASRQAVDDGFSAWTNVATATISLVDDGLTADLTTPCTIGAHKIVFNDPFGIIPNPVGCAGILALGGFCSTSSETKVVNGTTFNRALRAAVTFANGWGACPVWTQCNVAEVATHEVGHSVGLGHSSDTDATMYSQCHCDDLRCADVHTDDINGITFIYPPASPHDSVVLPVKPITVALAPLTLPVNKTVKVKVRNADVETFGLGHTIQLTATTADCPGGTIADLPDFDKKTAGPQDSVFVNGGKSKTATVPLVISSTFATFNHKAPTRCTITFTASTIGVPGNVDPNQSNDAVTMELNVIDKNDPEGSAVHESVITSMKPLKLSIADGPLPKVKTVKPAVGNADILPQSEVPGHLIAVTASDGTYPCPAGTVGVVDYDPNTGGEQNSVTVKGGKSASGKLVVTATSAGFATPNAKSPQRCTAVLTAAGPAGDTDGTNNTTNLVIDVTDKNDF